MNMKLSSENQAADIELLTETARLLSRMREQGLERVFLQPQTWENLCREQTTESPAGEGAASVEPVSAGAENSAATSVSASAPSTAAPATVAAAPAQQGADRSAMDWETLQRAVRACRLCPLCESRTNAVFGEGNPNADLMFIGEGPGADEDAQGRPFVGRSGELLTKMIAAMQFTREEVFIANIVKCRPPDNRNPEKSEAQACLPYVLRQIELIQPKVIVLLGATPLKWLLGKSGITRLHGQWFELNGIAVMPSFHPAFLLRDPRQKRPAWEDLQKVMVRLGKIPASGTRQR
ncbi:MAG: uracil-DNA glycosylase [Verrucomicrobiota bacterium]